MARRRFQRGTLRLRGKKVKKWIGKWREDVLQADGTVCRIQKSETIGTLKDYPTKRLAARALEMRLTEVNSPTYKPRPTATFRDFATRWEKDVLTQFKPSTGSGDRSRIRKHLLPELGDLCMKDINAQRVQGMIARKRAALSAKSIRNLIALLRMMWKQAEDWGYTQHDPFRHLVLPDRGLVDERFLSLEDMKKVISAACEPYKTYFWILSETGIRCGEAGGLPVKNLLLDLPAIKISQKLWHGKLETVKSIKGNRICEISPRLAEHLREYIRQWKPNSLGLLFATRKGTPWDADVVRKRKLYPLLEQLEIERCGFHAFRHGNETVMDQENVPMAVRQGRLGHSDPKTTMRYSHVVSEDARRFAEKMGELLVPNSGTTVVMSAGTT